MTKKEYGDVMRYIGQLEGLCMTMMFGEGDRETDMYYNAIKNIASDLESVAKGYDNYDIPKLIKFEKTNELLKGGDGDDV